MSAPPFLPISIANFGADCPNCGLYVKPDLWKRHREPFGPVYSDGVPPQQAAWVQTAVIERCQCGADVSVALNPKATKYPIYYYGDEAERLVGKYSIECYTLLGGTSGIINDAAADLREAKLELLPLKDPAKWIVHCKLMVDGRARQRSSIWNELKEVDVHDFFRKCAGIIKKMSEYSWNVSVFGFRETVSNRKDDAKSRSSAKKVMHQALLSQAIYTSTSHELSPRFNLDATKEIRRLPHIEGWSRDSYLGSRHYLAHEVLSHGNNVAAPEFLPPGSHPVLELADVHVYHFARSLMKRGLGEKPEIALNEFGKLSYLTIMTDKHFEHDIGEDVLDKYIPSCSPT